MKKIIAGLLVIFCITNCAGPNIDQKKQPQMHNIVIRDAPKFLSSAPKVMGHFDIACNKMIPAPFRIESIRYDMKGHAMYIIKPEGYIILCIAYDPLECYISCYCIDESFNWEKFIGHFIKACMLCEAPNVPEIEEV